MTAATTAELTIPADLKPADGRFGCGPSKVRPEQLAALAGPGAAFMGTSHRQKPVKSLVGRVRAGLAELFSLPDGLPGGARQRRVHGVLGRRHVRAGARARAAPHLRRVLGEVRRVDEGRPVPRRPRDRQGRAGLRPGPAGRPELRRPRLGAQRDLDRRDGPGRAARRRHGGAARGDRRDVGRRRPARRRRAGRRLLLRAAEELRRGWWPVHRAAQPGGAGASRRARGASDRWIPPFLSLATAVDNSGKDQTYNTPAVATLYLLAEQIDWMLGLGGLDGCTARTADSAQRLYTWAEKSPFATPFVRDPEHRSQVVGTVDFDDAVDAAAVAKVLRTNGIVDTEPYRKLGRNQLRIGMFPAVDPDDVSALTACVDWVVERPRLTGRGANDTPTVRRTHPSRDHIHRLGVQGLTRSPAAGAARPRDLRFPERRERRASAAGCDSATTVTHTGTTSGGRATHAGVAGRRAHRGR